MKSFASFGPFGCFGTFDTFDPRYICSERIPVTAQDYQKRITGLTNDLTYSVYLTAEDGAENVSDASNVQQGTPIDTYGFWDSYRRSGGASQGGCASTGLEVCGLLALAALPRLMRRKHR